ncbi:hypothetical protein M8J77_023456 [Diaphorina citri]|nr:hypothetical protein M8J77_023456 [Diaphorina citri]
MHHHSEVIPVSSPLQIIAVKVKVVWLSYEISVCNVYIPPSFKLEEKHLSDVISQVPMPCILCGDFNAHSPLWGAPRCNSNGLEVQEFLEKNECMFLLNDDQPTHINSSYGSLSTLDLSIISSSIVSDVLFSVHDDACSSDHVPVFIRFSNHDYPSYPAKHVWSYKKADWEKFRSSIKFHECLNVSDDVNDMLSVINSDILNAAKLSIPTLNLSKMKRMVAWWNDEIKSALNDRKNAMKTYKRNRSLENFIDYKRKKARAKYLIKQNKKFSWECFVDSIKDPITQSDMWKQVAKFKGKKKIFSPICALKNIDGGMTTNISEIVEILAKNYEENASDCLYDSEFKKLKSDMAMKISPPENTEQCAYNLPFNMTELTSTFKGCRSSAVGIDKVSYQMIIKLPYDALEKLLEVFNIIWLTGKFPNCWKTAVVVPVLKPNRDKLNAKNYRPITLLSCMNKIMERMINKRLNWVVNNNETLNDPFQSGNRQHRTTMDNLMLLEQEVLSAFQNKEYVVAVALDIAMAFERINKVSVLTKLASAGVGGPLFKYISNFMEGPQITVKVDSTFSSIHRLENSIRQGSSLSGNIFDIAVSDINKYIPKQVNHGMFVDDKIIYVRHGNLSVIQHLLQRTLDNISKWSKTNGLKFSFEKTQGIVFSKRAIADVPVLYFGNNQVVFHTELKWLGLNLDSKWNFRKHVQITKNKCLKAMNVLKVINNKNWGVGRSCLMKLFNAFIRPIMEYGSVIYGSAKPNDLKPLNTVYHSCIRIITGAFRTSPVPSLYVESGQPPLETRRLMLLSNYVTKLMSQKNNPCHLIVTRNTNQCFRVLNEKYPMPIRVRMERLVHINESKLIQNIIQINDKVSPWSSQQPVVRMLTDESKKSILPYEARNLFYEFKSKKQGRCLFAFSDGSKSTSYTGFAFSCENEVRSYKMNNICSIFTAELLAIYQCIDYVWSLAINGNLLYSEIVICSDSKSSLMAIQNIFSSNGIVQDIIYKVKELQDLHTQVEFLWVPSHCGIAENERVDLAAKNPTNPIPCDKLYLDDVKKANKKILLREWEDDWQTNFGTNKLWKIKKDIKPWKSSYKFHRVDEIVVCRLRIGHSVLTHKHLFKREPPPVCQHCQLPSHIVY